MKKLKSKKKNLTQLDSVNKIKILKETGLSLKTILNLSESHLNILSKKAQKLQEDALSDLTREKADALEKMEDSNADLAKINADIQTAKDQSQQETNESEEVDDVDNMGNPEWEQTDNGRVKQGLLDGEEVEIDEIIMAGGAPDPQASFNNPDAGGFQSQGPMDSYDEFDGESGVGLANEETSDTGDAKYDLFKKYKNKFRGLEFEMEEDTEQIDVGDAGKGEYTQTPSQQQAPDGMGDGGDPGSRGMGIESVLTKKSIIEVAVSKSQKNFYCFVKACRESNYKDCGTGKKIIDAAKDKKGNTNAHINSMCSTDTSDLPIKTNEEKELDNLIMNIIESYENSTFSKKDLISTIKETSETLDSPTIAPSKPTTTPLIKPKKPGRKSPYQPKHKPKPKAEDKEISELPSWLEFGSIFTPSVDKIENKNLN
tara:strand:+ start:9022 stop:10305 length:1284 start_codon:yes stop_codon:yes gene_type:complete